MTLHASTKFQTNYNDLKYIRSTLFFRRMKTWEHFQFTGSLGFGFIKNLNVPDKRSETNPSFSLNDRFFLNNFKGIKNMGEVKYKDVNPSGHKDKYATRSANFGFDKYVNGTLKISQIDTPVLSLVSIEPFIFASGGLVGPSLRSFNDIKDDKKVEVIFADK